jgi:hypothetical protein
MALTADFDEDYKSREFTGTREDASQRFKFYVWGNFWDEAVVDSFGPNDDLEVLEYIYTIIPTYRQIPVTYDASVTVFLYIKSLTLRRLAQDVWEVDLEYSTPDTEDGGNAGPQGNDPDWSSGYVQLEFNVSSSESNRLWSLGANACQRRADSTIATVPYTQGKPAPIGETIDGVEGTNVFQREFEFGIQAYFPPTKLTFAYVRRLYRLSCTLNNATFFGFPALSVLFLEASASGDQYQRIPVNFRFKVRPNFKFLQSGGHNFLDPQADDPTVGQFDVYYEPDFPSADAGPGPDGSFSGWDVIDYRYAGTESDQMILQKPIMRTIHSVYPSSNFDYFDL